jgi:hypothetical protein
LVNESRRKLEDIEMVGPEMVTTFSPGEPEKEGKLISELIQAINEHLKGAGIEAEEYDFSVNPTIRWDSPEARIPARYNHLIAYAIEGGSEGYYVHVGCLQHDKEAYAKEKMPKSTYTDWGFAKTYSPDSAYALAKEAQRFLTATRWN